MNWKKHNNGKNIGGDWARQAFNGPDRPALERLSEAAHDLHAPDWHRSVDAMDNDAFGVSGGIYFLMFPDRDRDREAADSFWSTLCEGVRCPSRDFVGGFVEGALKERDNKLEAIDREKQRPTEAGYDAGRAWYGETVHHWDQSGGFYDLKCDIDKMDLEMVHEELGAPGEDAGEFWGRQTADNNESPSNEFTRGFLRGVMAADRRLYGAECEECGEYKPYDELHVDGHYFKQSCEYVVDSVYCHDCLEENELLGLEGDDFYEALRELGAKAREKWLPEAPAQVLARLAAVPQDDLDDMEDKEAYAAMFPDGEDCDRFWKDVFGKVKNGDYFDGCYCVTGFLDGLGRDLTTDEKDERATAAAARQQELAERRRLEQEEQARRLHCVEVENVFPGFRVAIADNTFTVLNEVGQAKTSVRTSNREYVDLVRAHKWREAAEWLYERTDIGNARFREAIKAVVESLPVLQPAEPGRPQGFARTVPEYVGFAKA